MVIDQGSLFVATGICATALALTMLIVWMNNRADHFLVGWMFGMLLLGCGVILYSMVPPQRTGLTALAFAMEVIGFVIVLVGARLFTGAPPRIAVHVAIGLAALLLIVPAIATGYDGLGIAVYNFIAGMLMLATAAQYWQARAEAPCSIGAMTALYVLAALSFLACGGVLLHDGVWMLDGRPDNWAEQFNAVMCIAGITGIGALSLGLNQTRSARRHRIEALTDSLTGLLNRRALFESQAGRSLVPGDAVVVFDLDRFKSINDRHGHAVGDDMLRLFADAVRASLREDDIAARTGGEEFVMVMANASAQRAASTAERIRARFAGRHVDTPAGPVSATASAGVALAREGGESFEAVLHRADTSLYRAKDGGRDRVVSELQAAA